jgi:hypothetical protein
MLASLVDIPKGVAIKLTLNVHFACSMYFNSVTQLNIQLMTMPTIRRQIQCDYPFRRKERKRHNANAEGGISMPTVGNQSLFHSSTDGAKVRRCDLSDPNVSDILASRFLDPDVFRLLQLETPRVEITIPKLIGDFMGNILDIQNIANIYFDTIHTWMPIISKKNFSSNLPNYLSYRKAELCLLVICMKLSSSHTTTARTVLYRAAKHFYFEVESSGILSVPVLQAGVLIVLYEIGHGIYPAALLSVGYCARYAVVLEIDKSITPSSRAKLPWIEVEEQRRVWWSILILDRCVSQCIF